MLTSADIRAAWAVLTRGLFFPDRPILAQVVVTRRCNLDCGYCNEYDRTSAPVPAPVLADRIDALARLGTAIVTLTGGEPLLHPDVVALVGHIARRGMVSMLITNGYLLTPEIVRGLGAAGLYGLQLSVDNLRPNPVSRKSLSVLRPKLRLLAAQATFRVRVSSVLGAGPPGDAIAVMRAARELGLDAACAILHDAGGRLTALDPAAQATYAEARRLRPRSLLRLNDDYHGRLLHDGRLTWKCRAGARFLYVCEDGLVHYCSQQRGVPGIPLDRYGVGDVRRAFRTPKGCAATCTLPCVHYASSLDRFRGQDTGAVEARV